MKCYVIHGYNNFGTSIGDYEEEWILGVYLNRDKAEKIIHELDIINADVRNNLKEAKKKLKEIDPSHAMSGNHYYMEEAEFVE